MQQLQCKGLQLQAWRQQHAALPPSSNRHVSSSTGRVLLRQHRRGCAPHPDLLLLPASSSCLRSRMCSSSVCCSAAADAGAGDAVRPSAQAATPAAAAVDMTGAAGAASSSSTAGPGSSSDTGVSSTGSSNSSSSSTRGGYSSYSDMYKSLHNTFGTTLAAAEGASLNSSRSSQLQELQQHTAAAAAPSAAAAAGVEDALKKAQRALAAAESSLDSIHKLRSAQPPNKWTELLQVLRSAAVVAAAGSALVASHAFGLGWQWAGATLGALGLAARAYQRNAVTPAGAFAVAAACLATLGCSLRFGVVMLAYAYTSHKLRQYKEARQAVDFEFVVKPQQLLPRDWPEVLSIAAVPTVLAVAYGAMAGCLDLPLGTLPAVETWRADLLTLFQGAVLGWYACCCGDAWSRELGELSGDMPRLLTTLQPVRKGTHGAVTLLGLSGAAAGGLLVGLLFHCAAVLSPTLWVFEVQRMAAMSQWRIIPLGLIAGVCGSLVDSLLGALLQFTGFDSSTSSLTNTPGPKVSRISGFAYPWLNDHLVNVLAASLTAVLTALAALRMFG